jgi:2-dehydro-3-deoxygluconokinase
MTYDLFTLGETMLRFATPDDRRLEETDMLAVTAGGSESNLAANLARLGKKTVWFSRLPDGPLGTQIVNTLRRHGVDTTHVLRVPGERVGTYYLEFGAAPRGIKVIFDRAHSAASRMTPDDLPRDVIAQSRWVHLSGITPALSATCADTIAAAIELAKSHQKRLSFDVNYRALLWSPEAAGAALAPFCQAADIVFVALRDAVALFGTPDTKEAALRELHQRWGNTIVMSEGDQGAAAYDGQTLFTAPAIPVDIVDRIGAGDAFSSGIICRLMEGANMDDALHFGAAMSALKLTIPGDITIVTRAEVEAVVNGQQGKLHR